MAVPSQFTHHQSINQSEAAKNVMMKYFVKTKLMKSVFTFWVIAVCSI